MRKFLVACTDRTDGTKWNVMEWARSEQQAREQVANRIAAHVTIEWVRELK